MKKLLLLLIACLVVGPASAQILMVTGDYRVVDTDRGEHRIGIALREDDPNVRQNWVYVDEKTEVVVRKYVGGGAFRDQKMTADQAWPLLKKGRKVRVHGGRDWDGSIVAKKIWM